MKVRIGFGTSAARIGADELLDMVDHLVEVDLDSIWLSELLTQPGLDPLVALSFIAAHNERVKIGTTMLLPGRNPVRLAGQVAALDHLSRGRFLCTFVPGLTMGPELSAVGVEPARRGEQIDAYLPLLRRLWRGETVDFADERYRFDGVSISPTPAQDPFEVWLGGMATSALVRCGRLADGWLPARCTPAQASAGKRVVEEAASAAGRSISPEHFGVSLAYTLEPLDAGVRAVLASRNPDADPDELLPCGFGALRGLVESFIDAGFSKFVIRPSGPATTWRADLDALAAHLGDLQT